MSTALQTRTNVPTTSSFTPVHTGLLQRQCACGGSPGIAGECEECSNKQLTAQHVSMSEAASHALPSGVSEALGQSGSTSETNLRAFRQSRFGHDFSRVRLHPAAPAPIQTKLSVGHPGDEYEQEADRVAEQVMRMPDHRINPGLQAQESVAEQVMRMPDEGGAGEEDVDSEATLAVLRIICPECEDEVVQAKESSGQLSAVTPGLESQIETVKTGGEPLPETVRAFFEPRFGYNFSHVRIHTDSAAAETAEQLHALAYTVGSHVAFGPGQYAPDSPAGKKLLAHELTHVVQQAPQAQRMQMKATPSETHGNDRSRTSSEMAVIGERAAPIRISRQASPDQIHLHTKEDCDEAYDTCCDGCRRLPPNAKRRRALCWAACMAAYATCLATTQEALTFAAIVAAIVLAAADGPFPIGDAAAAALLLSLGITGSSGESGS